VVEEQALVQALRSEQIAGAAPDVYEHEPKIHPGLIELINVCWPSYRRASYETRTRMATMAVENVLSARGRFH
jgi:glyoxylate reductase